MIDTNEPFSTLQAELKRSYEKKLKEILPKIAMQRFNLNTKGQEIAPMCTIIIYETQWMN